MEHKTITNEINYQRLTEFENKLMEVDSLLINMYHDEFKGQRTFSKKLQKAIDTLFDMRADFDLKKLMELNKITH